MKHFSRNLVALMVVPLVHMAPRGDGPPQPPTQFSWIHSIEDLSPASLTVRAQTISPNDDGKLVWDVFMPRQDVESTKLSDVTSKNFRPAADRRGWNRRGRRIPVITPEKRNLRMEPIESNFRIDEQEMDDLTARFLGNEAMIRDLIRVQVPERTDDLAQANYRRVELDTMESWYDGIVTVRNPETNRSYPVEFDFADERMATVGTALNATGVNAYKELISWANDAVGMIGPISGFALRLAVRKAILDSAPTLAGNVAMSLAQLEDRISQDLSSPFRFFLMEDTIDVFVDGGVKTTPTKKWRKANKIAAVPLDYRVGNVAFAPVARAVTLNAAVPQARLDVRGCAVFPAEENNGRELDVECQLNAFPLPDENRIAVLDTLIGA